MFFPIESPRNRHPRGFTLVELLVVIAIIGILIALLLPAVQAAREAARRATCTNHLKQMGVAANTHENAVRHYPTGGWGWWTIGDPDHGFGKMQPGGWIYNLLPFLELRGTHDLGKGMSPAEKRKLANAITKTPLEIMICPTRRGVMMYPNPWNGLKTGNNSEDNTATTNFAARTDYAGNSGVTGWVYQAGPDGPDIFASAAAWNAGNFWADPNAQQGVIYQRSTVRTTDIKNGTSHVILIGEKYIQPDHYLDGWAIGDNESMYPGFSDDILRSTNANFIFCRDRRGATGYEYGFGSPHPNGVNFVFCDGSVTPISYDIDKAALAKFSKRDFRLLP